MKMYIKSNTGSTIIKVAKYGSEYTVYYKPYRTRRFLESKLPASAREFIEDADVVENSGLFTIYTKTPPVIRTFDDIEKQEVSISDVDAKDILINIDNEYTTVVNYRFKYDGIYQNSYSPSLYNCPMYPMGNIGGVSYGVVGKRSRGGHGGYVGYKIENGYLWHNTFLEDIKSDAMKYAKADMKNPDAWTIFGKIV